MRSVVYRGVGAVEVAEIPTPELEDSADAIVRVTASSICGSDLHFFHGKAPLEPGETIGHEAVGVVERVGREVTHFSQGDRVVVAFVIACGGCWFCRNGQTGLCEDFRNLGAGIFGGGLAGAQAELVRVPAADVNLLGVPDEVEDERALFVGDVLTTGYYAAARADIRPADTVAVVGAGPVGFFAVQAALALGAGRVVAVDLEPARLALVEAVGAEAVHALERNPQAAVAERTDGRGADVVIEAVGSPAAFGRALDLVRRGGRVVVAGMYASETVEAQLGVWWARGLDVRFTGVCPVHAWWQRAMGEVVAGRIDPSSLVSHRLPLDEAPRGYELFDGRGATKVLLIP
ncbi:MAG TPA: alcohol dehydrogenase catalytic domain-containing protein [Actinomycetota bacterium]